MMLSFSQLDASVVGCDSTESSQGAWRAHRLPLKLRSVYDEPPRFAVRRDCPSSVRLRFITDSLHVNLTLRFGEEAHPLYQGAVVVDNGEPAPFGPIKRVDDWKGTVLEKTDRTLHTIDIWLPHLCKTDVVSLELDDNSTFKPAPMLPLCWLAYGDSITQGFCASLPTQSAISRCALALNAEVRNLGVGGSSLCPQLADHLPGRSFDLISIAYGVNDFQTDVPLTSFRRNVHRLIDALHLAHPRCPIVLITPINFNSADRMNGLGLSIRDYRQALRDIAGKLDPLWVVDGETLVPGDPRMFEDWVHPNNAGFEQYARNLLPHFQRVLPGASMEEIQNRE